MVVSVPGDFALTVRGAEEIHLAWTPAGEDETGFAIEESTDGGASWRVVHLAGPTDEEASIFGLTAGIEHSYRMRTFDDSGAAVYSAYTSTLSGTPSVGAAIRYESLLPTSGGERRPRPFVGSWNTREPVGGRSQTVLWSPRTMKDRQASGKYSHPTISFPDPKWNPNANAATWQAHAQETLLYLKEHNEPVVIKLFQPERAGTESEYKDSAGHPFSARPIASSPLAFTQASGGTVLLQVERQNAQTYCMDPQADPSLWAEVGEVWVTNNTQLAWMGTVYPNPPLVILLCNNEPATVRPDEASTSRRYVQTYSASDTEQQRIDRIWDGVCAGRAAMWTAIKAGLPAGWQVNCKVVGFDGTRGDKGGTGKFVGFQSNWQLAHSRAVGEINRAHEYHDGWSDSRYSFQNSYHHQLRSPQIASMLAQPQEEYVLTQNADFWTEVGLWPGPTSTIELTGMTTARYKGLTRWIAMFARPRVLREYRNTGDAGTTVEQAYGQTFEEWYSQIEDVAEEIHHNDVLRLFHDESALVVNGGTFPNRATQFLPENWEADPDDHWYQLTTSADPTWSSANVGTAVPVWAFARVRGEDPYRMWLVYAFSTDTDRTSVTITIPEYGTINVAVPGEGAYYLVDETNGLVSFPARDARRPSASVEQQGNHLRVSWAAHALNAEEPNLVRSWDVERSDNGLTGWSAVASSLAATVTNYADETANGSETEYFYRVKANGVVQSAYSPVVSATTAAVPGDPTNIVVTVVSTVLVITWELADDLETSVTIQRSLNGEDFTDLEVLPAGAESYVDHSVEGETSYWYRVKASNDIGDSNYVTSGETTTPGDLPEEPTNLIAEPAESGVGLSWTEVELTAIDTYEIQRSTNSGLEWSTVSDDLTLGSTTFLDTTAITPNTHYWYRIRVVHTSGNSPWSNTAVSAAGGGGILADPNPPRNLRVTSITDSGAVVSWADCSSVEVGYLLGLQQIRTANVTYTHLPANSQQHTLTNLLGATDYLVGVAAVGANNQISQPAVIVFRTLETATVVAPTNLTLQADGRAFIARWTDASNNETEYVLRYWRLLEPLRTREMILPPNTQTARVEIDPFTGVAPLATGQVYAVEVAARNSTTGQSGWSPIQTIMLTPNHPADAMPPRELTVTGWSETSVSLSWVDTNPPGQTRRFKVERSIFEGIWAETARNGNTTHTDPNLRPGTEVLYRVSSEIHTAPDIWSEPCPPVLVRTDIGQAQDPNPPSALTATEIAPQLVRLTWSWVGDPGQRATGFAIYRSETTGEYSAALDTVGPEVRQFDDESVGAETTYYYVVRAVGESGAESADSNEAEVETSAAPGSVPSAPVLLRAQLLNALTAELQWRNTDTTQTSIKVQRAEVTGGPYDTVATIGGQRTVYIDSTLEASTTYYYVIVASNAEGDSDPSNELSVTTGGDPPGDTGPVVLTGRALSRTSVQLEWDRASGEDTSFVIQRATSSGGALTEVATVAPDARSYIDTNLTQGTRYFYVIDSSGNSDHRSNELELRTFSETTPGGGQRRELASYMRNVTAETPDITVYTAGNPTVITHFYAWTTDATDGPFPELHVGGVLAAGFNPATGTIETGVIHVPALTDVKIVMRGTGTDIAGYALTVYVP